MPGIKYIKLLMPVIFMVFLQTCHQNQKLIKTQVKEKPVVELKHVKLRGKLRVMTDYNSTNYFIYKGRTMGFQYEMLQAFADHLGVKLELSVNNDLVSSFEALEKGEVDLLGMNLAATPDRIERFNFTIPHSQSIPILVQRKNSQNFLDSINDLAGKTVVVALGSSFEEHLKEISRQLEEPIQIITTEKIEVEELIERVATGEIDYTISDQNVALVNRTYFSNLDISLHISDHENLAWALRKGADYLTQEINIWLIDFQKTTEYRRIYQRYFKSSRIEQRMQSEFFSLKSGKISKYDELLKQKAKMINWDWRLLSALVYQESRFDHTAKSWVGAFGLMQLMPETAYHFNVDSLANESENVDAGVRYLGYLERKLDKTLDNKKDKLKFVLASYNVGLGHILDARRLAEKNGQDPDKWDGSVAYYLLNKSKPEFYNDPVVKYGYCRGEEPYLYVSDILDRYQHYQNISIGDQTGT